MTDQQKYLLLGAIGVGGLAYWYFNYGPGATPAVTTTTVVSMPGAPAASTSPGPLSGPAGTTLPVPQQVSAFTQGLGPQSTARWNYLLQTLPASSIATQYANIVSLVSTEQQGGTTTQGQLNAVYNWFASNGIPNTSL